MGITGIILICILGILCVTIWNIVASIKQRNWKKTVFIILFFVAIAFSAYVIFVAFITSM